jgi:hypothetical protein
MDNQFDTNLQLPITKLPGAQPPPTAAAAVAPPVTPVAAAALPVADATPTPAPSPLDAPLNPQKVYNLATRGFENPVAAGAFARDVYSSRFGFDPNKSLEQMTTVVHGHALDEVAALNAIAGMYAPYDVDNSGEAGALAKRIVDGEASLPNNLVRELRLAAATHNEDKLSWLLVSNSGHKDQITELARAYGDAYQHSLVGSDTDSHGLLASAINATVPPFVAGVKNVANRLGSLTQSVVSAPFEGVNLHGFLKDINAKLDADGNPVDSAEAERIKAAVLHRSRFNAGFAVVNPGLLRGVFTEAQANEFMQSLPEKVKAAQVEFDVAKSRREATQIFSPSEFGHGKIFNLTQSVSGAAPDLLAIAGLGVVAPELIPAYGASMTRDLHDKLVYDQGLSPMQANFITAPAAVVYAFGAELLPKFGDAGLKATQEFSSVLTKRLGNFAVRYGKNVASTAAALELFSATDAAAESASKVLGGTGPAIPEIWKQHFLNLPRELAMAAVFAGPHAVLSGPKADPNAAPREQIGDPAKFAAAERQEAIIGLDPKRPLGQPELSDCEKSVQQRVFDEKFREIVDTEALAGRAEKERNAQSAAGPKPETPKASDNPLHYLDAVEKMTGGELVDKIRETSQDDPARAAYALGATLTPEQRAHVEDLIAATGASTKFDDAVRRQFLGGASHFYDALQAVKAGETVEKSAKTFGVDVDVLRNTTENLPTATGPLTDAQVDAKTSARIAKRAAKLQADKASGKLDEEFRQRVIAENAFSDVSGKEFLIGDERPRTVNQVVRDSFRQGYRSGAKNETPLNTIAWQAVDKQDAAQKLLSRADRQGSYESNLAHIDTALALLKFDPEKNKAIAVAKMDEIFGGQEAKDVRRLMHAENVHELPAMFEALQREYQARLRGNYAEDIARGFLKLKASQGLLPPEAKAKLEALREEHSPAVEAAAKDAGLTLGGDLDYHVSQLEKLLKAQDKLSMYKKLLDAGNMTQADFDTKEQALAGFKSGLLEFFKNQPFDKLDALHRSLAEVMATAKAELAANAEAKRFGHEGRIAGMTAEVEKSGQDVKFPQGSKVKDDATLVAKVLDQNDGAESIAESFGGGQNTLTKRVLYDTPRESEGLMRRAVHGMKAAGREIADKLGITQKNLELDWKTDKIAVKLGDGILHVSKGELLDLWLTAKDPRNEAQMNRGAKIKSQADWERKDAGVTLSSGDAKAEINAAVEAHTTPNERDFAQKLFDKLHEKTWTDPINAAFRYKSGIDEATNPDYWPTTRAAAYSKTRGMEDPFTERAEYRQRTMNSIGATKQRVENVMPFQYRDIWSRYTSHVEDLAAFAHMYAPITEAKNALNSPALHSAIVDRFGKASVDFLNDTYDKAASLAPPADFSGKKAIRWLERNYMVAQLWGRLSSMVKTQVLGSIMVSNELAQRYGAKGLTDFARHSAETAGSTVKSTTAFKADLAKVLDPETGSGQLLHRWVDEPTAVVSQTFRPGVAEGAEGGILSKYATLSGLKDQISWAKKKVSEFGMDRYADIEKGIGVAAYRTALDNGASPREAIQIAENAIRAVKPMASAFDETRAYRNIRPYWVFAPFLSAVSRSANILKRDVTRFNNAEPGAAKSAAAKKLLGTSVAILGQAAVNGLMTRAVYSITTGKAFVKTEDDKSHGAARIAALHALDLVLPGSGKIIGDVVNVVEHTGRIDETTIGSAVDDAFNGALMVHRAASDDGIDFHDPEQQKALLKAAKGVGALLGVPLAPLEADRELFAGQIGGREEQE